MLFAELVECGSKMCGDLQCLRAAEEDVAHALGIRVDPDCAEGVIVSTPLDI